MFLLMAYFIFFFHHFFALNTFRCSACSKLKTTIQNVCIFFRLLSLFFFCMSSLFGAIKTSLFFCSAVEKFAYQLFDFCRLKLMANKTGEMLCDLEASVKDKIMWMRQKWIKRGWVTELCKHNWNWKLCTNQNGRHKSIEFDETREREWEWTKGEDGLTIHKSHYLSGSHIHNHILATICLTRARKRVWKKINENHVFNCLKFISLFRYKLEQKLFLSFVIRWLNSTTFTTLVLIRYNLILRVI